MRTSNRELWLAFITCLAISLVYIFITIFWSQIPAASGLFGHGIGILGFILMLMTEVLYTIRKRSRNASWGRMSTWLQFHIFTGLVGPFMVLLHTSWKFNGLAGLSLLLTLVIVASGFIGRYIYTAVPRTIDGAELEADEIQRLLRTAEADLQQWLAGQPGLADLVGRRLETAGVQAGGGTAAMGASQLDWKYRFQWWRAKQRMDQPTRLQAQNLDQLLGRQQLLQRQINSLVNTRRLMALWHSIHIPIGLALFTAAFIHAIGAFYYATLLR